MPSCSVSSAPQETSRTRNPVEGSSRIISASPTSAATPERLSFAPATVELRQTSATSAAPIVPRITPPVASRRRPVAAAVRVKAGPAMPIHHCGSGFFALPTRSGASS